VTYPVTPTGYAVFLPEIGKEVPMGTTSENTTKYVSFLLDETGSMHSIKEDTIGGFNEYVDILKKDGDDIAFSLVSFNSNGTKSRYVAEPLDAVPPLTNDNYRPAAMTPLIDASVKTIKATAKAVKKRKDDPVVLVVIQTDGYENCSRKHTAADLAALVKEKTEAGWEFVFLGAGLDAFEAARSAGVRIDRKKTVQYDRGYSRAVFRETAVNSAEFLKSGDRDWLDYSQEQRTKVRDKRAT
tara:strand:- start:457 stop:1179 length:723 start_codon:yes stop_codon:yes gene_type:complete